MFNDEKEDNLGFATDTEVAEQLDEISEEDVAVVNEPTTKPVPNKYWASNPDWNRILDYYHGNPVNPDFKEYVVDVLRTRNKTILKWNGKKYEV